MKKYLIDKIRDLVGIIVDDMRVVSFEKNDYNSYDIKVKCMVCSREKTITWRSFNNGSSTKHKSCMYLVPRDDHFHSKFKGMIKRTSNEKYENYHNYGGRGITCEYKYYIDFYDDFYESYLEFASENGEENTTIDRINVNESYCKNNIRWATPKQQANNRNNNINNILAISPDGKMYKDIDVTDFAEKHNLIRVSIYQCLRGLIRKHKGWKFKIANN